MNLTRKHMYIALLFFFYYLEINYYDYIKISCDIGKILLVIGILL